MVVVKNKIPVRRRELRLPPATRPRARFRPGPHLRLRYGNRGLEIVNMGFRSAQRVRESGYLETGGASIDAHLSYSLETMRSEAQRLDRDNSLFSSLLDRTVDCQVGDGFRLHMQTPRARVNRWIADFWKEFWTEGKPEIRQLDKGPELERKHLRQTTRDGDIATLKTFWGLIQEVDADQLWTPMISSPTAWRVEQGIGLNRVGQVVEAWITDYDERGFVSPNPRRVGAADFIWTANRKFATSQTRGAPANQGNFAMCDRINDVLDGEALCWQAQSRQGLIINQKEAQANAAATSYSDQAEEDTSSSRRELANRYHDIGECYIFHGEIGEEIRPVDRTIPGVTFTPSLQTFLRLLAMPMGFPLEVFLLDFSKVNFAASRAITKQFERTFRRPQEMMVDWLSQILTWKLREPIRKGSIPELNYLNFMEWHGEPYPFADAWREEQAREGRYRNRVTSQTRELRELGIDADTLMDEQVNEFEAAHKRMTAWNNKHPDAPLTIRDFSPLLGQAKTPAPAPTEFQREPASQAPGQSDDTQRRPPASPPDNNPADPNAEPEDEEATE